MVRILAVALLGWLLWLAHPEPACAGETDEGTPAGSARPLLACPSPAASLFRALCLDENGHEGPSASSAIAETAPRPYWRRNLFKRFAGDQRFLATSWWPAEGRRYRFSVPLLVGLAGAAGSTNRGGGLDVAWQRSIQAWTDGGRRGITEGLTRLGDRDTAIVALGVTYLAARWTGHARLERATSLSAEALLNSALYTTVLKRLSRRTRPLPDGSPRFFVDRPDPGQETTSFPSGHAAGAFAVAAVFAWEYRDRRWVPWVAYGTAGLIALSRVGLGRHYPSDVLFGAVLGQSLGTMVTHRSGGAAGERRWWSRLEPLIEPDGEGRGIAYRHSW